jgi:hypothetical protein
MVVIQINTSHSEMGPAYFVDKKLIPGNNDLSQHTEMLPYTEMVRKENIIYFCMC